MSEIIERIYGIRRELDAVNPECEIVVASKTRSIEEIKEAISSGMVSAAGENRVQELTEKYTPEVTWDMIGRLQSNKVNKVVGRVRLIHGLDRASLREAIERESSKRAVISDVLVEINTCREESKGGIFLEELDEFLEETAKFPHIRVRGLMAVTEIGLSDSEVKAAFDRVYRAYAARRNDVFNVLSMGMSDNYRIAAECGATLIRPGRVVFGERIG